MHNHVPNTTLRLWAVLTILLLSIFLGYARNPPIISTQPGSQTNLAGFAVTFGVAVEGTGPFTYQWRFNNTNLQNDIITTVAGNGSATYSGDGGAATNAGLNGLQGVAFDMQGSLFIADTGNNCVRKVDANGTITTVAGNGSANYTGDGGNATNAGLNSPSAVALDPSGNLLIADQLNQRIRKVDANGIITTVAGNGNSLFPGSISGTYSGDGGPATNAGLFWPSGIIVDVSGNLFIADNGNERIRKVDTNGVITTVVGNGVQATGVDGGPATNALLDGPYAIAFDATGKLHFSDTYHNSIRKVDASGIISTVAGGNNLNYATGDGGPAINATIDWPFGLAFDAAGRLYIAAGYDNNDIRRVDSNGIITTVAGAGNGNHGGGTYSGDGGSATNATLNSPYGLAFDALGNIYIADAGNNRVREVHFSGYPTLTLTNLSALNAGDYRVIITNSYGCVTSTIAALTVVYPPSIITQPTSQGIPIGSNATLNVTASGTFPLYYSWYFNATNLIQTGTNALLFVSGFGPANVGQYIVVVTNAYGSTTSSLATLKLPPAISVITSPASQTLLSGSNVTFSVEVDGIGPFTYQWQFNGTNLPNNIITTVAGGGNTYPGVGDGGLATDASLYQPCGVKLDSTGNLYIADNGHNRIRKVDTNGVISTVAGNGDEDYSGDGVAATNTSLSSPKGVTIDAQGNIYIADSANQRIRRVGIDGIITTVVGNNSSYFGSYSGDGGAASNATMNYPTGVGVDTLGNLYIADSGNNRIRRVDTNGIITTFAGNGSAIFTGDGGVATNAGLNSPFALFADAVGDLYIADNSNGRIRKVMANGIINTVAGGGSGDDGSTATNASLYNPHSVTVDTHGNLYITDDKIYPSRIRMVDTNGIISTVAGGGNGGDGGPATNASLNTPYGVALDIVGNLYVSDYDNKLVREVHFAGYPTLTLTNLSATNVGYYSVVVTGPYGSVTSSVATLTVLLPPSILVQPIIQGNSNVTISVTANGTQPLEFLWYLNSTNLVQNSTNASFTVSNVSAANVGQYQVVITNAYGSVTSQIAVLSYPSLLITQPESQIVFAGSNVALNVTASGSEPLIYQWQWNGTNLPNNIINTVAGGGSRVPGDGGAATNAVLNTVFGLASDNQGNAYIADYGYCRIRKIDAKGIITTVAGNGGYGYSGDGGPATNASLYSPESVAVDASGNLFIAEYIDSRIRKVDTNGIITTLAGNGIAGYSGDGGPATNASLSYPYGVVVDSSGGVLIADTGNNCIRMVDTNGTISTVVGGGMGGLGDGEPASQARLNQPSGMAFDAAGNLIIADSGHGLVREVSTNGIIMTVAGGGATGSGDGGVATNASLLSPFAVAVDAMGNLFIADSMSQCVREVGLNSIITTVAGNGAWGFSGDGGAATNANLYYPSGLAMAASGGLLIADEWNFRIREVTLGRTPAFQLGAVNTNNAGTYDVIVSNPYGNGCVTSSVVSLTVVSLQISNRVVILGSNVAFSAQASGPVPVAYQWQFNSENISWATNASLMLTNVQLIDQGIYSVIVGNSYGAVTSSTASLIVTGFPPSNVAIQPTNQAAMPGSNYFFTVTASGTPPLSYQWQHNGTKIDWATNTTLTLTNVQAANNGTYDVVVSNYFGSVTSSNVTLILLDLSTALNPGLTWTTSGSAAWFPETSVTHDGIEGAQSGSVSNGQQSVLQTTVTGPGTLSFWWRISSLGSMSFFINGVSQSSINFVTGWQLKTFYLGAGVQNLSWTYYGGTAPFPGNAAWLDQVTYVLGGTAPLLTVVPTNQTTLTGANVTFNLQAVGTPPLVYQWEFGGTNINSGTNAILNLTNVQTAATGNYAIVVTNNYGTNSTGVILVVQPFLLGSGPTNVLMTTNGFELNVGGVLAQNSLVIYASTNLINWLPVFTNPPTTGSVLFLDTNAVDIPFQFYKAIEQ